jgi:hypothetical protein
MEPTPVRKVVNIDEYKRQQELKRLERQQELVSNKTDKELELEILDFTTVKHALGFLFKDKQPNIEDFPVTKETTLGDLPKPVLFRKMWREAIEILLTYFGRTKLIYKLPIEIEKRIEENKMILLSRSDNKSK